MAENPQTPPPFSTRVAALVAREASQGKNDPERMADAIESMAGGLALLIASATGGDPEGMNTMLEGATAHAFERASEAGRLIRMLRA